ncbi:MAG: futalosine hydrolase [Nitrospiraceae bacterium]|nr:futalosine hydrolase [Nitrospiraceae bacterium]
MEDRPKILIVFPTKREQGPLLPVVSSYGCPHLISGLGPVSTAFQLTRFIERMGIPHMVILVGVAGAYRGADLGLGDVCLAVSEAYGDLGRQGPSGIEPIYLEGEDIQTFFALEPGWRKLITSDIVKEIGFHCGPMLTVSCTTGNAERARELHNKARAIVENMEGAAAAQVCDYYQVPLLEIRGISNWIGELDRKKWRIDQALEATARVLKGILEHLSGTVI